MQDIHNINYYMAHPAVRLLVSLLIPIGILGVSIFTTSLKRFNQFCKHSLTAFFFFLIIAIFSNFTFIVSSFYLVPKTFILFCSYFFIFSGSITIPFLVKQGYKLFNDNIKFDSYQWLQYLLISGILISWLLISLGPVTDADSLNYHLGIPLNILHIGKNTPQYLWSTSLLVGTGDFLNLIGLYNGTDCLGAVTQIVSFFLMLYVFTSQYKNKNDSIFYTKLLISPFLLLFLISSQKNQLLGVFTITLAFILQSKKFHPVFYLSLLFYACSVKYSFYIPATALILYYFHRESNKLTYVYTLVITYLFFLFPQHLYHFIHYQTPIPPFLNQLVTNKVLSNIFSNFSQFLRSYIDGFPFPVNLFFPKNIGSITTTLGIAPLFVFIFSYSNMSKEQKNLFMSMVLLLIFSLIFAQKNARFFLSIFYIFIFVLSSFPFKDNIKKYFNCLLTAQLCCVFIISIMGAIGLFPGALTKELRDKTLSKNAFQYNPANWATKLIPSNSLIISEFRTLVFFDQKFVANDFAQIFRIEKDFVIDHFVQLSKNRNINDWYYLMETEMTDPHFFSSYIDTKNFHKKTFTYTARNPLNKGRSKTIYLYKVKKEMFSSLQLD